MIDHHIVRLDISVHDALTMAEVQCLSFREHISSRYSAQRYLEQFVYVVSNIIVNEFGVQASEVGIIDVFSYEAGRFALRTE